ncbi:MAG: plasmid pRiA4b ORF-3 family protein [Treponema sp.]|nr:plasmid pRiA4b ORF-3 family protein [Treponema sp.]
MVYTSPMAGKNIYVFHIGIEDSKPEIWRELRVPGNFTLADLHTAIQIVFGWTDSHLHSFTIKGTEYMMEGPPEIGMYDEGAFHEGDYILDDFGLRKKQVFSYLYDFGDSWEHKITVTGVIPFTEDKAAPLCLGGEYACPIEDSGGVWGYAEILEILKDPGHKEYDETREWAGDVDPLAFDAEEANRLLKRYFKPAKGAKAPAKAAKASAKAAKAPVGGAKPGAGKSPPEEPKAAGEKPAGAKAAGKKGSGKKRLPDGKLKKLYALMGRVKELKPWEKLWDTDLTIIDLPGREEPGCCAVMGKGGESFGVVVYPGFASILSLLRMLNSESDNPFAILGYQDCLLCHLGQRDELEPEERARIKELGITFRGKRDWVYFRKAIPGCMPWYIDGNDADTLIEALPRFIDAYAAFAGGLNIDFENDQIIRHRYSNEEGKWITEAGTIPPVSMKITRFGVDSNDLEPLRFKKQTKTTVEAEVLYFPQAVGTNEDGAPVLLRICILADSKTGMILSQRFLGADDDANNRIIDMLFKFISGQGRPAAVMVRDEFAAGALPDFCEKTGITFVHSGGMPAIDEFAKKLPSFLNDLTFPSGK